MLSVLFLAGAYHPFYSANGYCLKNVVDACIENDINITCIVNDAAGQRDEEIIDDARIIRIHPRQIIRWQQWRQFHDTGIIRVADSIIRNLNRFKMLLFAPLWPFISPLYSYRFFSAASKELKRNHYDAIVSVYTPIDSLIAGYLLKGNNKRLVFIPYYLDALAGGYGPTRWSKQRIDKKARRWEERIDKRADVIVSMESSHEYHEGNPLTKDINSKRVFLDIPMMKAYAGNSATDEQDKNPYVLYAGSIPYPLRDPRPILEIMVPVCLRNNIDFLIAGECSEPRIFDRYIEESQGHIKYLGKIDREAAQLLESGAMALVNIGNRNPNAIPSKVFEYMGHLRPIISTYSIPDEPSMPYLQEYGYALFVDESATDRNAEVNAISSFLEECLRNPVPIDACENKFHKNRPEAFVSLLHESIEGAKND